MMALFSEWVYWVLWWVQIVSSIIKIEITLKFLHIKDHTLSNILNLKLRTEDLNRSLLIRLNLIRQSATYNYSHINPILV